MTWFAAVARYKDGDDDITVESLYRVRDIKTVHVREFEGFSGVEIVMEDDYHVYTETYDLRGFAMNVLGGTDMLDAIL